MGDWTRCGPEELVDEYEESVVDEDPARACTACGGRWLLELRVGIGMLLDMAGFDISSVQ